MPLAILVSGRIGVGKTTLSNWICKKYGTDHFRTVAIIRELAKAEGISSDQYVEKYLSNGKRNLIKQVLDFIRKNQTGPNILIDGIWRHTDLREMENILRRGGFETVLFYVESPRLYRLKRLMAREKMTLKDAHALMIKIDNYFDRFNHDKIRKAANALIENKGTQEQFESNARQQFIRVAKTRRRENPKTAFRKVKRRLS